MEYEEPMVLDNGTALFAVGELRRAIGSSLDRVTSGMLNALDRLASAMVQADGAKTVQEESRHLVRALAAASEVYVQAAALGKSGYDARRVGQGPASVSLDETARGLLKEVDRAYSAVVESSSEKTTQMAMRHLVREVAASAKVYAHWMTSAVEQQQQR